MSQRVLVCLTLLLGLPVWSVSAAPEARLALVIGNSAYPTAPLTNPVRDAQLMASTLKALGFTVIEVFDTDQKTLKRTLQDFGNRIERSVARDRRLILLRWPRHSGRQHKLSHSGRRSDCA